MPEDSQTTEANEPPFQFLRAVCADAALAFIATVVIGLIIASLAAAGIITMNLAYVLLALAWFVAVLGTFLVPWQMPHKHRGIFAVFLGVMLCAVGLYESAHFEKPPTAKDIASEVVGKFQEIKPPIYGAPKQQVPNIKIEHPPILKMQKIVPPTGLSLYSITNSVIEGKTTQSISEAPKPKTIAKSNDKQPPNVLSMFMHDARHTEGVAFNGHMDLESNRIIGKLRVFYFIFNDFRSNSRYLSIYIPQSEHFIDAIVFFGQNPRHLIDDLDKQFGVVFKPEGQIGETPSWDIPFSGSVYIYTEEQTTLEQSAEITNIFKQNGASVQFRSTDYVLGAWKNIKLGDVKPIDLYELHGTPPLIREVVSQK